MKRITVKLKSPNPLFEKWLTEWRDKAKENDSKMQHTFNIALKSLKLYPLPLETGKDCIILKGFGAKLCEMLDNKLKDYKSKPDTTINYKVPEEHSSKTTKKQKTPKKSQNSKKPYIPAYRSGPYAILKALLEKSQQSNYPGFLMKQEIINTARNYCDKSFTKPDPGSFYTAWSSMSNLITKTLVEKKGNPPKFSLTPEGFEVAIKLIENDDENEGTDNKMDENELKISHKKKIETNTSNETNCISDLVDINSHETILNQLICSQTTSSQNSGSLNRNEKSCSQITTSQSQSTSQASNVETIIFAPNTFDVVLLVDTQETEGLKANPLDDDTKYELNKLNILYEVRHMKVGDFTWIARERTTNNELVLPYIIERKRMDDLGSSIKDGRYHEQKKRLKQSNIKNLIYVIESHGNNTHTGLPLSSLMQAATNTLIQDGFQVKFTENHKHTMEYLGGFTLLLDKYFKNKTLMSTTKEDIQNHCITDDLISLLTFKEFNKGGAKNKEYTVRDIFIKQILQLKGVSVDKALAITERYPTPRLLKEEYEKIGNAGENLLAKIVYGPLKRSVGSVISKTVYQLYTNQQLM